MDHTRYTNENTSMKVHTREELQKYSVKSRTKPCGSSPATDWPRVKCLHDPKNIEEYIDEFIRTDDQGGKKPSARQAR